MGKSDGGEVRGGGRCFPSEEREGGDGGGEKRNLRIGEDIVVEFNGVFVLSPCLSKIKVKEVIIYQSKECQS